MAILGKRKAELDDVNYVHLRKIVGYVHRHLAQRPTKERIDGLTLTVLAHELGPRPAQEVNALLANR